MTELAFPAPPPPHAARRASVRDMVVGLVLGAGTGVAAVLVLRWALGTVDLRALFPTAAWSWWTLAAMVPGAFLAILAHEAGHLAGGALGGLRPAMLFTGPLLVEFAQRGPRLRFNRHAGAWGGLAVALPTPDTTRRAFLPYVAGGPLASFLLCAIALAAGPAIGGTTGGIVVALALLSFCIGLATLIPGRTGGYLTDGAQLLALLRDDPGVERRLRLGALLAQGLAGTRPRDLDAAAVAHLLDEATDPAQRMVLRHTLADIALDRGDRDAAAAHVRALAEALGAPDAAQVPALARQQFALRVATWLALEGDAPAARAWRERAAGPVLDPLPHALADAALARAEGRDADRTAALTRARDALPRTMDRGAAALAEDLIARLDAA